MYILWLVALIWKILFKPVWFPSNHNTTYQFQQMQLNFLRSKMSNKLKFTTCSTRDNLVWKFPLTKDEDVYMCKLGENII